LSPLLYLSRHLARRPARRLKFPEEKPRQRRLLALGFYGGTLLIVGGLIGLWARWCLGNRDPWIWAVFWLLEGKTKWTRPALLAYWAALGSISVAGWNRQLARSRRYRTRSIITVTHEATVTPAPLTTETARAANANAANVSLANDIRAPGSPAPETPNPLGLNFSNLPNLPNLSNLPNLPQLANGANVATELLDAADKHVPTLSLNARRKFFHVLAVVMFVPGVAVDVSFLRVLFLMFRSENKLLACFHTPVVWGCVCSVHVCRICPVFRAVSVWGYGARLYE
jgi:dolichol kinase